MKQALLLFIAFSFFACQQLNGQETAVSSGTKKEKEHSFVPAPYLNYSRSIGAGFGVIPMYMFQMTKGDTISPQSLVGALGIYTTNKTYFAMGFGKLYFAEDRWRVSVAAGIGDINFQVFIDRPMVQYINYNTNMFFAQGVVQTKVFKRLYAGPVIQYLEFLSVFGDEYTYVLATQLTGIGLDLDWDGRDNVYYPHKGVLAEVNWNSYPLFIGNEEESNSITSAFNYFKVRQSSNDVWAHRFYGNFGLGDVSFNQQTVVGRSDLRGYTQGDYRGDGMMDVQSEYRLNFENKMGMVFFGGVGTIYGAINEEDNWTLLPSVGTGFRYLVFPENNMNIGLDVAAGKGDWGIYFRVGEAF